MQKYDFYLTGVSNILPFYQGEVNSEKVLEAIEKVYGVIEGKVLQDIGSLNEIQYVKSSYPMNPSAIPYTFNNFNSPELLLQITYRVSYYDVPEYAQYHASILDTFLHQGKYGLSGAMRVFYLKNFSNILGINPFAFLLDRSYRHTFGILTKIVIENNIKDFEEYDCDSARKFVEVCRKVKKALNKIK